MRYKVIVSKPNPNYNSFSSNMGYMHIDEAEYVEAETLDIHNGTLMFYNDYGVVKAYASNNWKIVEAEL